MHESELLTRRRCSEVFQAVSQAGVSLGVSDLEVLLAANASALTRFANNAIHQNVAERAHHLSVRAIVDGRTARATTNRLDAAAIQAVVEEAVAVTRSQVPDPDLLSLAEPEPVVETDWYFERTAACGPESRAAAVAEAIRIVESAGQIAAGISSTGEFVEAILNSRGLEAYHAETMAQFSITAMGQDSSGWAKATAPDLGRLDPLALAREASHKAALSKNPRELAPGRYTVILEPAAVLDLVGQMFADFSATAMHDQRSFLTGRLGEKLFGDNITIRDDSHHPLQSGAPFDGEGVPRRTLTLVERGVPRQLAYCRSIARKDGVAPTGHGFPLPNEYGEAPLNIVMQGGNATLESLIATAGRGILVTRLWYIREVDPFEKIMTGMTRDGTFLVEDSSLVCGLKNFRFNQGLIEMFSKVDAMTSPVRASGEEAFDMVVPAMKVHDFNFTEVTRF